MIRFTLKQQMSVLSLLALVAASPVSAGPVSAPAVTAEEPADGFIRELKFGVLRHDVDNLWSGFSREGGVDLNFEAIFSPFWDVAGGTVRPALGASINTSGDTSKVYFDARWEYGDEEGLFFGFGVGGALHNGENRLVNNDRKALGSRLLFHIPLEIGYRPNENQSISVYFDHVSNAYTQDENEGLDTLGVRFGFRY